MHRRQSTNWPRQLVAALAVAAVAITVAVVTTQPAASQDVQWFTYGAAVRQGWNGSWSGVVNAAHANTLVAKGYTETNGDIRLNLIHTGGRIVTVRISPDETLARRGITCGASAAPDHLIVRCFDRDGRFVPGTSSLLGGTTANFWAEMVLETL